MTSKIVSSNNFVDSVYSMVASRINVLVLSVKDGFANRSVFVELDKVNFDIRGSILLSLFMKVHLSLRKKDIREESDFWIRRPYYNHREGLRNLENCG